MVLETYGPRLNVVQGLLKWVQGAVWASWAGVADCGDRLSERDASAVFFMSA